MVVEEVQRTMGTPPYAQARPRIDQGERVTRQAAMAKLFATEAVGRVADRAVQLFGGQGVMEEGPVQHLYRDVRVMRIYEGTSEIQRLVIAREALK
jgi:alkylation response protein AidB-like acyl-CoA dehydrogenase